MLSLPELILNSDQALPSSVAQGLIMMTREAMDFAFVDLGVCQIISNRICLTFTGSDCFDVCVCLSHTMYTYVTYVHTIFNDMYKSSAKPAGGTSKNHF